MMITFRRCKPVVCRSLATVAVKNLPFAVTQEGVGELLAKLQLPAPQKVEVALTQKNLRPRGWAYVTYDDDSDADLAIQALSNHDYQGRKLKAATRGDPLPIGENRAVLRPAPRGASEEEDFFSGLRADLIRNDSRDVEDERLRLLLKQQYGLEDETDSLDGLKSSLSRRSATAAEGVAEFGGGGGGDAKASETQKIAAKERQRKESELKKLTGAGAAIEGGDLVPGKWAETVISVDRVTKVTKGGRVMSFRALVVVGNAKGSGGFGVGKAMLPPDAVARAIRDAKKNLIVVDRHKNTGLVHSIEGRHNSCKVVLRAVPPGYGMKGGRIAKAILKQFGIADCTAKAVGRRKPFGVVRAIFKALARHESLSNIARSRGRRIIEMEWRRGAHN